MIIMNKVKILFTFLLLGAMFFSCSNSDDWKPASQLGADNPGAYFDFNITSEAVMVEPYDSYFTLTLVRAENKKSAAFQLPITVVQANSNFSIPTSVTFAAGATTAELKINITSALVLGDCSSFAISFDDKFFDPWKANASNSFLGYVCVVEKPTLGPVTPENISTYVQEPGVPSLSDFRNDGTARYHITLMSSKLNAWFADYSTHWSFTGLTIIMPYSSFRFALTFNYAPISNGVSTSIWYHQPTGTDEGLIPLLAPENNPLSDVRFNIPQFTNRSNIPFSASGFASAAGGAIITEFRNWLQAPTGFTIIQDWDDKTIFWFRSKADPNDWFKAERQ
jgi:hypothetical protein